jgi:hypothetical protein
MPPKGGGRGHGDHNPTVALAATGSRPPPTPLAARATPTPPMMLVTTATMVAACDHRCPCECLAPGVARPMAASTPAGSSKPHSRNRGAASGSRST